MEIHLDNIKIVLELNELEKLLENDILNNLLKSIIIVDKEINEIEITDDEELYSTLMEALIGSIEIYEYEESNQPEIERLHNILFNCTI